MKKTELKKMIKPIIRECLTEIFAEMKLESIIEGVVRKTSTQVPKSISKPIAEQRVVPTVNEKEKREILKRKLGIDENEWATFYQDTVPTSEKEEFTKPEKATEQQLRDAGLFRDFSKFVT